MNTAIPLRRNPEFDCAPYSESDCDMLGDHLLQHGYIANRPDISWAWYKHSDARCAGWLYVAPDEAEYNVHSLLVYLQPAI